MPGTIKGTIKGRIMKTQCRTSICFNPGGWKKAPETTLYLTAPVNSSQLQTLGGALGQVLWDHLPAANSILENVSGITSIEYMPILELQSLNARYLITSKFKDMDRSRIRYTLTQAHEACHSLEYILDEKLVRVAAGLAWYAPKSFAIFGSRNPQLLEYWEIFAEEDELNLRISGPYKPNNALPIRAPWDELLEKLFSTNLELSLIEAVRAEVKEKSQHI